jgi:outer membrane protein insertion porin family
MPDILSPRAGNSIAAGQMTDRREVIRQGRTAGRRCGRWIATGALLLAMAGLISAPALAAEAGTQARDADAKARDAIDVQGNRRIDAETVRSYFHAGPDGRLDEAARDAGLKALLATGLFDKVTIERAGERLVVHLAEAPVLDRVAFEGNKKIQDKQLTAIIESKPRGTP